MAFGENNGLLADVGRVTSPVECRALQDESEVDPDVLLSMSSLGCFRDHDKLLKNLMSDE